MNKDSVEPLGWGMLAGSIGPRVRLLRNALAARSIAASAPYGLPTGSLTILALIVANPGRSQAALAAKAGIKTSALTGIVAALEAKGLLARDRSATDRRRNSVTVTEAGQAMIETLFGAVSAQEAPLHEALGPDATAQLLDLLDRALGAVESRG